MPELSNFLPIPPTVFAQRNETAMMAVKQQLAPENEDVVRS